MINILSLFDGISCGQIALNRAGIKYDKYFASEIDKNAIKVTQSNYPNTIQLGDVSKIDVKTFFLSEVGSFFSVNSMDDTNLQNIISEWEMLYWLDKEFTISATIRTQKQDEGQKLQSSSLQRFEEIWFKKRGLGDIVKTRNIEKCRTSRDSSDKREYSELQCGEWWYVYRGDSRDSEKNINWVNGQKSLKGNKGKIKTIGNSTVSISRVEREGFSNNKESNERPDLEKEIHGGERENRLQSPFNQENGDRKEKKSNPIQDFKRELQRRNEINDITKNNWNFLSIHKDTQATLVKSQNRLDIFIGKFSIIIAGSPCQGFSFAGKQLNFEDSRSKLFFEFVRLLKECSPKYFLLENVNMKKEYQDVISSNLGVNPIKINSSLVSAQNRNRLYWTNIPSIMLPQDRNIVLYDILELKPNIEIERNNKIVKVGEVKGGGQGNRVYSINGKGISLNIPEGWEKYVPENLPNFCDPYNKRELNGIKSTALRNNPNNGNMWIKFNGRYRNLTRIECERLQTVPDNYTISISEPKAKKCLGNGWTVDVITHIFSFLPKELKD